MIENPYYFCEEQEKTTLFSLEQADVINEWLNEFDSTDYDIVPADEELTDFGAFRFGLLGIAALTLPTGMYYNTQLANEAGAIYRSVEDMNIDLPADYIPQTGTDIPVTEQWVEDEKNRLTQQLEENVDLDERRNNALALVVIGTLANISAVIPNYFHKEKKKAVGNFVFIDSHSTFQLYPRKK